LGTPIKLFTLST